MEQVSSKRSSNYLRENQASLKYALLVSAYTGKESKHIIKEHLKELSDLALTLGIETTSMHEVSLKKIDAGTFIGKGKLEELKELAFEEKADMILFDEEISPNQQRNLEKLFGLPVLDRTEIILDIFAMRARSKEATLQIERAKIQYELPRLKRMWTHLSRQKVGGKGYLKGEGEKQIEIDRRILKQRAAHLEKELKEVRAHRKTQRLARTKNELPSFAIVGYTNAGKSTLLNALTNAGVLQEDKLFATLDTTTRKFMLPNKQPMLLVDTVGFIRKLPHTLVESFKSTLEEVNYTDVLLHVLDVSHPMAKEHAEATMEVLKELGANKKPIITVLNKIDLCENPIILTRFKMKYPKTVPISAKSKKGFEDLTEMMMQELKSLRTVVHVRIPQKEYAIAARLIHQGQILEADYKGNDVLLKIDIPKHCLFLAKEYLVD